MLLVFSFPPTGKVPKLPSGDMHCVVVVFSSGGYFGGGGGGRCIMCVSASGC